MKKAKTYYSQELDRQELEYIKSELSKPNGETWNDSEAIRVAIVGYADMLRKARQEQQTNDR